jgi:hypothetical protein
MPKGLKVDLLVVRENYAESKPCEQCIRFMKTLPVKIRKITYSTDGSLITESLDEIKNTHETIYYRSMNFLNNQQCVKVIKAQNTFYVPKIKCRCPPKYRYKCKHNLFVEGNRVQTN